jgi:hypothetical protein
MRICPVCHEEIPRPWKRCSACTTRALAEARRAIQKAGAARLRLDAVDPGERISLDEARRIQEEAYDRWLEAKGSGNERASWT